jgi:hypothetical protein
MIDSRHTGKHSPNPLLLDIAVWLVAILLVMAAATVAFALYRLL